MLHEVLRTLVLSLVTCFPLLMKFVSYKKEHYFSVNIYLGSLSFGFYLPKRKVPLFCQVDNIEMFIIFFFLN